MGKMEIFYLTFVFRSYEINVCGIHSINYV